MIERRPQPPRLFLAADKGPHFVQLCFLNLADYHRGRRSFHYQCGVHRVKCRRFFLRALITVIGLTPSTRAVSRTPLPLSALSTICRLTSGNRPVLRYRARKILRSQSTLLHRYRCAPFACRPYLTTSALPHSGHCTSTTATPSPAPSYFQQGLFSSINCFSTLPKKATEEVSSHPLQMVRRQHGGRV
jgi:hypothetical protein